MKRPKTMFDSNGLIHEAVFLDAVYWRPVCSDVPAYKPKGWMKHDDTRPVTCLSCIGDVRSLDRGKHERIA